MLEEKLHPWAQAGLLPDFPFGTDLTEDERLELLRAHRERVLAQLAEVTANLAAIDHKIALYTDRLGRRALSA